MNEHFTIGTANTRMYTIPASLLLPPVSAPVHKVKSPVKGRKQAKKGRVERPHNAGKWTVARYLGVWRSAVRRVSRFWEPKMIALRQARFPWPGPRGRKWGFTCAQTLCKPCHRVKTLLDNEMRNLQ